VSVTRGDGATDLSRPIPRRDAVQQPPLVEPRATLVPAAEVAGLALITESPEHIRRLD
jgi:hypothetical protein